MTDALRSGGLYQDELGAWKDANGRPAEPPTEAELQAYREQAEQDEASLQAQAERIGPHMAALTATTGTSGQVAKPEPEFTGAADQPVTSLSPGRADPVVVSDQPGFPPTTDDNPPTLPPDEQPTADEDQQTAGGDEEEAVQQAEARKAGDRQARASRKANG